MGRVFLKGQTQCFYKALLFIYVLLTLPVFAQVTQVTTTFSQIRTNTLWPVVGSTYDSITSSFGPRIQYSTKSYDWHRGIDINAPLGTSVVAPLAGTFFGIRNYADGGTTVILRHAFPSKISYAGRSISYYYTFYMHLSSVDPSLTSAAVGKVINRGDLIGKVGHSGGAVFDHLHWELRVGTPYSLEWQLANPNSIYGAKNFGFDPHVHPLFLAIPYTSNTASMALITRPGISDGIIQYSSDDDQTLLNRIEVSVKRRADNSVITLHILDYNDRIGYDPTSDVKLNTINYLKPYISPKPLGTSSPFLTDIIIPKTFIGTTYGDQYLTSIRVFDIWGRSTLLEW